MYALPQYLLAKLTWTSSQSEKTYYELLAKLMVFLRVHHFEETFATDETVYSLETPLSRCSVRYAEFSGRSTCEIAKPQHSVL